MIDVEYSERLQEFVASKSACAPATGIDDVPPLGDYLFPFQKDLVRWALRRGKAAIFAAVGLGKTRMQLEFAIQASSYLEAIGECSEVIILTPLAVAAQTVREAQKLGISARYCKGPEDMISGVITVTNYDRLERFNPKQFGVVVLDESSIIKHQDSKTRDKIIGAFKDTPFRLACTATPAPNDRKELGNHAEFLGVMTLQEMLSEFFVHDSGDTGKWRLKGHAEDHFWQWVASWGAVVSKPSDLGYDDGEYDLPPLQIFDHSIAATLAQGLAIHAEKCMVCDGKGKLELKEEDSSDGEESVECCECGGTGKVFAVGQQLSLFPMPATTLKAQRRARRATIKERCAMAVDIVRSGPNRQWLVWCELNDEADELEAAITKAIPGAVEIRGADKAEAKEAAMLGFASGSIPVLVSKPSICGFGMNFQECSDMVFVGVTHSYEAVHQALGRSHRFGQKREVSAHFVYSELEGDVRANLARKSKEFTEMAEKMRSIVAAHVQQNVRGLIRGVASYNPTVPMSYSGWLAANVEI